MGAIRYSVIIPVFNEEAVIKETYQRLTHVMGAADEPYEHPFINEGSTDQTVPIIKATRSSTKTT